MMGIELEAGFETRPAARHAGRAQFKQQRATAMRIRWGVGKAGLAAAGLALLAGQAAAQDVVRHGLQRGALGALKVTLPMVQDKYKLKYDLKTFNDSTTVILALEQKELE